MSARQTIDKVIDAIQKGKTEVAFSLLHELAEAFDYAPVPADGNWRNQQSWDVWYTNYKGERSERHIVPIRVWFGNTEWHPKDQYMMHAFDLDKNEVRDFALKGFVDANYEIGYDNGEGSRLADFVFEFDDFEAFDGPVKLKQEIFDKFIRAILNGCGDYIEECGIFQQIIELMPDYKNAAIEAAMKEWCIGHVGWDGTPNEIGWDETAVKQMIGAGS